VEHNPSRPVPAVRVVALDPDGRVLIVRRAANTTDGGSWCLPGGKVDYGDTVEGAAARELAEEAGLRALDLCFLFYQDSLPPTPGRMHCINLYFECRAEGNVTLNEESTESAWITAGELSRYPMVFRNDEGLSRYFAERDAR
jgi:8-oxo-dGTP pyrophosphatase MutT (NUDIX family)